MTAFAEWEGIGPITATSVTVVGTDTSIVIDNFLTGIPPGAEIQFNDLTGNGADPAFISSQRDSDGNAMGLDLFTGVGNNGKSGSIIMNTNYISLDFTDTAGGNSSRVKLTDEAPGYVAILPYIAVESETWHTPALLNGWSQIAGYLGIAYRLGVENEVLLRGTIHNGVVADNTQIMTLPVGYRPAGNVLLRPPVGPTGSGNVGSSRIFITTAGGVFIYGMAGVTDIGFDSLSFTLDA
jgi:hypothetical protein